MWVLVSLLVSSIRDHLLVLLNNTSSDLYMPLAHVAEGLRRCRFHCPSQMLQIHIHILTGRTASNVGIINLRNTGPNLLCPLCAQLKDFVVPVAYKKWVPIPSAVSIPFIVGAPIAIDFCLGGFIMLAWCACEPLTDWTPPPPPPSPHQTHTLTHTLCAVPNAGLRAHPRTNRLNWKTSGGCSSFLTFVTSLRLADCHV